MNHQQKLEACLSELAARTKEIRSALDYECDGNRTIDWGTAFYAINDDGAVVVNSRRYNKAFYGYKCTNNRIDHQWTTKNYVMRCIKEYENRFKQPGKMWYREYFDKLVYQEFKISKAIKEQFGSDFDRFVKMNPEAAKDLWPTKEEYFEEDIDEMVEAGKVYMMDKESCVIWKAKNIVGYKDGILIMHDR